MAISFPAPEASVRTLEPTSAETTPGHARFVGVGSVLRRGYDRLCSAIFDADGDCMRL